MKFTIILLLLLLNSVLSQRPPMKEDKNFKYGTRFRAVSCDSHQNSTMQFTFCYIKSYSRTFSTLNFGFKVNRDIKSSLYIRLVANYRYGNIYREIVDSKWINWCQIMDGINYNLFLKFILDVIRQSIPKLFHKCSYEGLNEFYNITIDDEVPRKLVILPEGQYKYVIMLSDNDEKSVLDLMAFTEVKSPVKSSFG